MGPLTECRSALMNSEWARQVAGRQVAGRQVAGYCSGATVRGLLFGGRCEQFSTAWQKVGPRGDPSTRKGFTPSKLT
jgi:hypothetical protein